MYLALRNSERAIRVIVVASAIALLVVAGFLVTIPTSTGAMQTFSGRVTTGGSLPCGYGCPAVITGSATLPPLTVVGLRWTDVSGGIVDFRWWYGTGPWADCGSPGTGGSCSFLSQGGNYSFSAVDAITNQTSQQVNYTGSFG
jgi:hypothetical protein